MKKVQLFTDGACSGNPGPGGWACIMRYGEHKREMFGSSPKTTNNRMEMAAALEGFRALKEPCEVDITTDSEYLKKGMTEWIAGWKRKGWMTSTKKPVVNQDLWKKLDEVVAQHQVTWHWVKGHASHPENNRADELAVHACQTQSFSKGLSPELASVYALRNGS
jgi:ribonuclease HI